MDGLFKKKNFITNTELVERSGMDAQMAADIHDNKDAVLQSHLEMRKMNSDALESRDNSLWFTREDSPSMRAVKNSLSALYNQFTFDSISTDKTIFDTQKQVIKQSYDKFIADCTYYIDNHNPWTKSGKARKKMVETLKKQAVTELAAFDKTADRIFLEIDGQTDIAWMNVLHEIRCFNLDTAPFEIGHTGGQSSNVTVLKKDGLTMFFKPEEKAINLADDLRENYENNPECAEYKSVIKSLCKLLDDAGEDNRFELELILKHAEKLSDPENHNFDVTKGEILDEIKSFCKDNHIKSDILKNDRKLIAFLAKYGRIIKTDIMRYNMCIQNGIEGNSVVSNRNVATSRMARLMGVSDLVCESVNVNLTTTVNGETKSVKGNLMKGATGQELSSIRERYHTVQYSPDVIRQLNTLQMFDFICGQFDRNNTNFLFNYIVKNVDGHEIAVLTGIQAIDNDMSFTSNDYENLIQYAEGSNFLIPLKGKNSPDLSIASLDEDFVAYIAALDPGMVRTTLRDIVSDSEIDACISRLTGLKQAIQENSKIIRPKGGFTPEQIEHDYQNTHSSSYAKKYLVSLELSIYTGSLD